MLAAPGAASDASIHCRPPCQPVPFHHWPLSRSLIATCATVTPVLSAADPATATGPAGSTSPEAGALNCTVGLTVSPPATSNRNPVLAEKFPAASPERTCSQYDPPAAPPVNE